MEIVQILAVLFALSVVIGDARPAGGRQSVSLPVMPAGSFGPLMRAGPTLDYDDLNVDPLDALIDDPLGSMGKALSLGGGGGGGMKKLLIIG